MKRFLSLLLIFCFIFSLAGCSTPQPAAPAAKPGRWVEEELDVPMPGDAQSYEVYSYGDTLEVVFYDTAHFVTGWSRSTDFGASWQALDISFLDEPINALRGEPYSDPSINLYCDFRVGENGEVWFIIRRALENQEKYFYSIFNGYAIPSTISYVSPPAAEEFNDAYADYTKPFYYHLENGKAVLVPCDFPENLNPSKRGGDREFRYQDFYPMADGSCLFTKFSEIIKINLDGSIANVTKSYDQIDEYPTFCQSYNGQILLAANQGALLDIASQTVTTLPFSGQGAWGMAADGSVYAISSEKLQYIAPGSTLAEELATGKNYYFGGANNNFSRLLPTGEYLFAVINNRLFRYYYDPQAILLPQGTVTVFSMHDNSAVRQTIAEMRLTNPEWEVVYRVGDQERSDAMTQDDLIKSLHTELLAGTGPDVLILDDMAPVASYLESGLLTDLTGLIDTQGLYPNLLNAGRYQEKLYAIPAGFGFPAMASFYTNAEWFFGEENPASFADHAFEGTFPTYDTLLQLLARSKEMEALNRQGQTFYNTKQVYLLNPYLRLTAEAIYTAALPELSGANANPQHIKDLLAQMDWMTAVYDEKFSSPAFSMIDAVLLKGTNHIKESWDIYREVFPLPSVTGKKAYLPYTLAAIPMKKTPCEGAAAFINAMLSPGVQAQLYNPDIGLQYDNSLFSVFSSNLFIPLRESCLTENRYQVTAIDAGMRKAIHNAALQLDTPVYFDLERAKAFYDIAGTYIRGSLPLEEATQKIMDSFSREDTLAALEREK